MPQNPATNCCPSCPASPPASLTCTIGGSSFPVNQVVPGTNMWEGAGANLCGNGIFITVSCGGQSDWTVSAVGLATQCANGSTTFQVTSSSPIRIAFQFVPGPSCCQTTPMDGTIIE